MDELIGSREFCIGVNAGISLYQNVVVKAHEQKSPLKNRGFTLFHSGWTGTIATGFRGNM